MVKKRLEDLLREEAEKSPQLEDQTIQVPSEEILEPDTISVSETSHSRRTSPTKAELETMLKELRAALEAAQEENTALQQEIVALHSDSQEQKTLVEKLQSELEQAKKMILQLSEHNSKPAAIVNSKPAAIVNTATGKNQSTKLQKFAVDKSPRPTDQPNSQSNGLFNQDVGWFD